MLPVPVAADGTEHQFSGVVTAATGTVTACAAASMAVR